MTPMQYLYIREDGRIFGITDSPTPEDFEHAKTGLHSIIRLADLHHFGSAGRWVPTPDGILVTIDPLESDSPPFHGPAKF